MAGGADSRGTSCCDWPWEQQRQGPEGPEVQEGQEMLPQSKWLSKLLAWLVTSPGGVLKHGSSC